MDVVITADEHDLLTTPYRPDLRQVVEPGGPSPELHRLAKPFDDRAPYREARTPVSRADAKGGSVYPSVCSVVLIRSRDSETVANRSR